MTDPLSAQCPACLAQPAQTCIATSSDLPRQHPHRLRGLAAHPRLYRCGTCRGSGWAADERHEGLEALDLPCPVCAQPPGEYCTEAGEGRDNQHDVRWRAADLHLMRCPGCGGIGWQPEDTDTVRPRDEPPVDGAAGSFVDRHIDPDLMGPQWP